MNERSGAEVLRTGRDTPPAPVREVRAGPLTALLVDGDLRSVRLGGVELVQRIYLAVRDLDWNTLPGEITDVSVTDHGTSFDIGYTRRHRGASIDYLWRATITGSAGGTISYQMHGEALTGFRYAKIGICVHHPVAGYAGQPFSGVTPDGPVSGHLPDTIGPQVHLDDGTDLPLFEPVSELELSHRSGGVVRFDFTGDLWEMEDQRNWTDASYKSASTPARLGYQHQAHAGQLFSQQIVVSARDFTSPASACTSTASTAVASTSAAPPVLEIGGPAGLVMPPIGLGCTDPAAELSPRGLAALRAVAPAHLRVDLAAGSPDLERALGAAASLATRLGCAIELAVFTRPGGDSGGLGRLREALLRLQADLARVLAFSPDEESSFPGTVAAVAAAVRGAAGLADVPVIAGTNIYFNELNRHRLPPGQAAGLAWSVNPQIHAFDDLSLMENLQAQPDTAATARSFAPDTPLFVTPVTLRPRFNAVATTGAQPAASALPSQADPRQPSLLAAAWTLGSVAALASAGVAGLTYYDTVGPGGVVESERGSPDPAAFRSQPDAAYPLAIVLADACGLRGGEVVTVSGVDPAVLTALAVRTGDGTVLLLGNLTRQPQRVLLRVRPGAHGRTRLLDEHTCALAARDPAAFLRGGTSWTAPADLVTGQLGLVTVPLGPYGTARLEVRDV